MGRAIIQGKSLHEKAGRTTGGQDSFDENSTRAGGFAQIGPVSQTESEHSRRKAGLLAKLEARALACPGLYPVKTREDFLRLATDHGAGGEESICQILEVLWRRPDEAVQMNAQSLIRRGQGLDRGDVTVKKGCQEQGAV